jgi:7-carboxy-7-deazaguanine synthase
MPLPLPVLNERAEERVRELKALPAGRLLVHEVYVSLQGEGTRVGRPCVFIRTTGCHLRCSYCDTAHAFHEGEERTVDDVVREVTAFDIPLVLVTGGEPLLQKEVPALLSALADAGLEVLLETSGAVGTEPVDERVSVILDVKTPGSGEEGRNLASNYGRLKASDEVKYVICDDADYVFAVAHMQQHGLADRCEVLFSPEAEAMQATKLAGRIVDDRLPVRMQLQLHRVLWGERRGV